jgi:WD40 repeat protein
VGKTLRKFQTIWVVAVALGLLACCGLGYAAVTLSQDFLTGLTGVENWVRSVAWSPHGTRLAAGRGDNKVTVWNVATRTRLFELNVWAEGSKE